MPKEKGLPKRDEAFRLYEKMRGKRYRISQSQENSAFQIKKSAFGKPATAGKTAAKDDANRGKADIHNEGLNERQRLFCIYYVKSFNSSSNRQ